MHTPLLFRMSTSLPLFPQDEPMARGLAMPRASDTLPVEGPGVDLLQLSLSRLIAQPDCARRMRALEETVPRAARLRYRTLMHGLWARRLAIGARADDATVREALDEAWSDPATQQRWQAFVQVIGLQACARLARRSLG